MSSVPPTAMTAPTTSITLDRAEQACERCRKHKYKCVPSGLTDRCERCYKRRLNCVFDRTKKRRRRESTTPGVSANKVAMIEERLDKVYAMLTPETMNLNQSLLTPEQSTMDSAQSTPSVAAWDFPIARPNPPAVLPPSLGLQQQPLNEFGDQLMNVISNDGAGVQTPTFRSIAYEQARMVIETSKYLSFGLASFIDSNGPLSDLLSGDYPIMIAAMLVSAGHIHLLDSATLACEFRLIMSQMLFSKGKRNIYVLQSLLIFLLRHVHYMNKEGPSVSMVQNICVSQIIDLGIDKKAVNLRNEELACGKRNHMEEKAEYTSLLVCNYLCCGLTFKCQNAKLGLPLAESARESVEAFLQDNTFEISEDLLFISQLCGFIDDIQETFKNPALPNAGNYPFDAAFTRLHMRRIELRLDSWQEAVAHRGLNGLSLAMASRFARVLLYARALQPRAMIPNHLSSASSVSGLRLSIYTYCLNAIKILLDGVINLSETDLNHMNFVEWIWTMSTFTALGRLSHPSLSSPDLDLGSIDISGLYDQYTDAICSRVDNSPTYSASKHGKWSFPAWLRSKCASSKQTVTSTHPAQATAAPASVGDQSTTNPEQLRYDLENSTNRTPGPNLDQNFSNGELLNFMDRDWSADDFPWESLMSEI